LLSAKKEKKMSALLFDMDGTVIDSEPLWLEAEIEVMAELGCHWDAQDQQNCLGGPMDRTEKYMQERSGNIKPYGYFRDRLNLVMLKKFEDELKLIPDALELILAAKRIGLKTALVTASAGVLMNIALKKFPVGTFDATVSRDDVVNSKPNPEPYLRAANLLRVEIESCVIFEDSKTGVTSGLGSGAQVIGIPHLIDFAPHKNLRIVDSLSDLSIEKLLDWYPTLQTRVHK
jgi:HAD superfamily hydrolase (TIGR01509 family)